MGFDKAASSQNSSRYKSVKIKTLENKNKMMACGCSCTFDMRGKKHKKAFCSAVVENFQLGASLRVWV